MDQFGAVRTINKTIYGKQESREFMTTEATRATGSRTTLGELDAEYEGPPRQRGTRRVSTSSELPGTNKVTRTLLNPLVDNRSSVEEALTRVVEQNKQGPLRMSEIERAVHAERDPVGGNKSR